MSPQSGNGSQGDSWGGRGSPPDLGELFRQGKVQFGQMLPGGSMRGTLIIALRNLRTTANATDVSFGTSY